MDLFINSLIIIFSNLLELENRPIFKTYLAFCRHISTSTNMQINGNRPIFIIIETNLYDLPRPFGVDKYYNEDWSENYFHIYFLNRSVFQLKLVCEMANVFLELGLFSIPIGLGNSCEYFFFYIQVMIMIKIGLKTISTYNSQMGLPFRRKKCGNLDF